MTTKRGAFRLLAAIVLAACLLCAIPASGVTADLPDHRIHLRTGPVDTRVAPNELASWRRGMPGTARWVVQLDGPMTPERRRKLQDAGVELENYLPPNAYVIREKPGKGARSALPGFVRWAGQYRQDWKVAPEIGTVSFQTPYRQDLAARGLQQLIVILFEGQDVDAAAQQAAARGAQVLLAHASGGPGILEVLMPVGCAADLATIEGVRWIEEASEATPRNDTNRWIVQSNSVGQTPIWNRGIHGEGQIGGLIDGRFKLLHCDFEDPAHATPGPDHRKVIAYRGTLGADPHGTHTAGTFVGDKSPYGVADTYDGIAFAAKLSFGDPTYWNPALTYEGFLEAHNDGARVHSNSWGDDNTVEYVFLCEEVDRFMWNNEDDLILFAVTNLGTLKAPENAKNLLAVAASEDTPYQGNHCTGGTGPTIDGRRRPEVYAPGCETLSANSSTGCGTATMTGTSMACPAVAGAGLLVRQYFTDGFYPTGAAVPANARTPSGALMKAVLINGSVNMTGLSGYPGDQEGWGRLLLDNSLYFPGDAAKLYVEDVRNASGLSTGQYRVFGFQVAGSSVPLRVTLVWTDYPATVGANPAAVNDLDLVVTAPDGAMYRGNVFWGGQSLAGGSADPRNNTEQVHRLSPAPGNYTVAVQGTAINQGMQGFALVVTGDVVGPMTFDCNGNGVSDAQDVLSETSQDCQKNGIPDECEGTLDCNGNGTLDVCEVNYPDCNSNGVPDACDLASNPSADCNMNGLLDVCEGLQDCNNNAIPDVCESFPDCNGNGVPDTCDIASGTSQDCNGDGEVPDECDEDCNGNGWSDVCGLLSGWDHDCNGNVVVDGCEIAQGVAQDCNGNGFPDECEPAAPPLEANFETGLPEGWSATGLWHVTSACALAPNDPCDPPTWAYFGDDGLCKFDLGHVAGVLRAPAVDLSSAGGAWLDYCSFYRADIGIPGESGWNWAWVSVNGVMVDLVSNTDQLDWWLTRSLDLSPFAGQIVTIEWHFDSIDETWNYGLGWQIDEVRLTACYSPAGMLLGGDHGVVSVATHGAANDRVALLISPSSNIEPRRVVVADKENAWLEVPFDRVMALPSVVAIPHITGITATVLPPPDNSVVKITMPIGVTDQTCYRISLAGSMAAGGTMAGDDANFCVCYNEGDVDRNRTVSGGDADVITDPHNWGKTVPGGAVDPEADLDRNGTVSDGDTSVVTDPANWGHSPTACPCDIGGGSGQDCNGNSVPDECDIDGGTSQDCNTNGVPDECDVAPGGGSDDCDADGVPDECEPDCNANGTPDACDRCGLFLGDRDRDCDTDLWDFAFFQDCYEALGATVTGECACVADMNTNGVLDLTDYAVFEAQLGGPSVGGQMMMMGGEGGEGMMAMSGPGVEGESLDAGLLDRASTDLVMEVSPDPDPWTYASANLSFELRPVGAGEAMTTLAPHTTYEVYYAAATEQVGFYLLIVVAQNTAQGLTGAAPPVTGDWSGAGHFLFRDSIAETGAPVPAAEYGDGWFRTHSVTDGFFPESGSAGSTGLLCTITTGEPGDLALELYMDWPDPDTFRLVMLEAQVTLTVAPAS